MRLCPPALLLIMFLLLKETACYSLRQLKLYEFQEKIQEKKFSGIAAIENPFPSQVLSISRKSDGRVFYPIGYGADPTGAEDSTGAIMAALDDAFKVRNGSEMLPGINDLGGVTVDLQGGSFRISSPVRFPPSVGNILEMRDIVDHILGRQWQMVGALLASRPIVIMVDLFSNAAYERLPLDEDESLLRMQGGSPNLPKLLEGNCNNNNCY